MSTDVKKLLIVDDDEAILSFFQEIFPRKHYRVECVSDGEAAVKIVAQNDYDVVVTDLCMPRMDGLHLIQKLHERDPDATVVAITGFGTIKDAVSLMKTGAYDVLTKPFSLDEIRMTIDKAIAHSRLAQQNRELERRLHTSEQLAAVGTLAASVAHEVNNPLDAVIRFVNLSLEQVGASSAVRDHLEGAREGLDRISGVVRGLLDFSRSISDESKPTPLGDMIEAAVRLYEQLADQHGIEIIVGHDEESTPVAGSLFHVISNVIRNAIDAIDARDDGGRIVISTQQANDEVLIKVSDDGPGMAEDVRAKVFEPFFSTKKPGVGTGLGLSICRQIVERQRGDISIESGERGTVVSISLPARRDAAATAPAGPAPTATATA